MQYTCYSVFSWAVHLGVLKIDAINWIEIGHIFSNENDTISKVWY